MIGALRRYGFQPLSYKYYRAPGKTGAALQKKETILFDQDATLANIVSLFNLLEKQEEFSPDSEGPPNNLIIYYSGHGIAGPMFGAGNYFYWVPGDYKYKLTKHERPELYSWDHQLIPSLYRIRFQNLIFINDSCFSGAGLNLENLAPVNRMGESVRKEKRSVWALCSCAADQLSYGVEDKKEKSFSLFTHALVDMLTNHKKDAVSISILADQLNKLNDMPSQSPFCGRLNIIPDNHGYFDFTLVEEEKEKKSTQELFKSIKDDLPRAFNYNKERVALRQSNSPADSVLIFSNPKESALPLMLRSARTERLFKAYGQELRVIKEKNINHAEDDLQRVFSFFCLAMGLRGTVATEQALIDKICTRLSKDYFICIFLNEDSRKNTNPGFVTTLLNIVRGVQAGRKSAGYLHLFIMDELDTDYKSLQVKNDDKTAKLFDKKIVISREDFENWFTRHDELITDDYERKDYVQFYLKQVIYENLKNIFDEDKPPALVVREICKEAKCPDLAEFLLSNP